ncbi:MAG: PIN domain-containing protein [Candidatus Kerfeldbacteria bacterium]|nr:PIN domain-containing protein [Candidatus Kerfeldbacteria bacterium]
MAVQNGKGRKGTILVDADAFVALIKENDSNRERARAALIQLMSWPVKFIASNYAFAEAVTVLSQRAGKSVAHEFIQRVKSPSSFVVFRWVDEDIEKFAIEFFYQQRSKNVSFADCVNMAIMEEDRLDAIFSFDAVYKKNGVQTVEDFLKA